MTHLLIERGISWKKGHVEVVRVSSPDDTSTSTSLPNQDARQQTKDVQIEIWKHAQPGSILTTVDMTHPSFQTDKDHYAYLPGEGPFDQ